MKSNQKPRRSLYYRTIYIYIYKSCTCPNNLDKNSFSLVKNRQFLEAGERGCSILINLYELSLPPTRQRKYSLNKESPLYRHILSRLIYLLRWKASWGGMQVRPPFQGPDTATSTLSVRRLCSTNVTKGGEIVLRPLETDLSHTRWSSSMNRWWKTPIGYLAACRVMESFFLWFNWKII